MTGEDFRALALSMDGAEEREHMGHPDFRVGGKIFASLDGDEAVGVLRLSPEQQEALVGAGDGPCSPAGGAWGRQGWTRVRLTGARKDRLKKWVRLAWEGVAGDPPPGTADRDGRRRRPTRGRR